MKVILPTEHVTGQFFICWRPTAENPDPRRLKYPHGFDTRKEAEDYIDHVGWELSSHVVRKAIL